MSVLTASVRLSGVQRHVCGRVGLSGRVGVSAGAWGCLRGRGAVCGCMGVSAGAQLCQSPQGSLQGHSVGDAGDLLGLESPDLVDRLLADHVPPPGPFLLQAFLALAQGAVRAWASHPPPCPLPGGLPLTLCRGNLVSKTLFSTKLRNVSTGHREPRVRGEPPREGPARSPRDDAPPGPARPPAHCVLTAVCRLAVQDEVDNSDSRTQELAQGGVM